MNENGQQINYSIKELLNSINEKLDSLAVRMDGDKVEIGRRVGALEARLPIADDLAQRFVRLEADWSGFQQRVSKHTDSAGHPESLQRLASLENEIDQLRDRAIAADAVEKLMRTMAEQRRWLIGLTLTIGLGLLGLLFRVWTGH